MNNILSDSKPTLPDPSTFDILPALHELLCRLLPPIPGATDTLSASASQHFPNQEPLEISQLAGEVSSIKARIRKARREVEALEDGERTVMEQGREMGVLRAKIERQVEMLRSLKADPVVNDAG